MIEFLDVDLTLSTEGASTKVLSEFSAALPSDERLVILGHDGVGKTTLIRLIAGLLLPVKGSVMRHSRVSFPVGYSGGFKRKVSVLQNIRHAARLYGTDDEEAVAFVEAVTGLGDHMEAPFEDLPPQARVKLAYAVGYGIAFDTYLIDDRIAAGDTEFRVICEDLFWQRMQTSGCIMTTKVPNYARRIATKVAILEKGGLRFYDSVDRAIADFRNSEPRQSATQSVEAD